MCNNSTRCLKLYEIFFDENEVITGGKYPDPAIIIDFAAGGSSAPGVWNAPGIQFVVPRRLVFDEKTMLCT